MTLELLGVLLLAAAVAAGVVVEVRRHLRIRDRRALDSHLERTLEQLRGTFGADVGGIASTSPSGELSRAACGCGWRTPRYRSSERVDGLDLARWALEQHMPAHLAAPRLVR